MRPTRKKAITYSSALHAVLLIVMIFGLPTFFEWAKEPEPQAISVEILPIAAMSNVKPAETTPAPEEKKEEPKPAPPKPQTPVAAPEPPKPEPIPEPKPAEKKPEEKKPEPKPEEKKPEKKPKSQEDDLMAVLKSVKENAQKEEKKEEKTDDAGSKSKSKSDNYDPEKPLALSEMDAIRSQIAKCWNMPAGAKDAYTLKVILRVQYQQDGTLIDVKLADASKAQYASDTFFRAAADSAMRAVHLCSPLKNLPGDKYDTWKDMEMTFDPKEMLY